jgi:hypothetical protein
MGQARAELLEMLSGWSQAQGAFRPSPEKWSTSEILEHLYASEFAVINRMWKGIDGLRSDQPIWKGEHTHRECSVEAITTAANFANGNHKAHPLADVRFGGPLCAWLAALDSCQPLLDCLGSALRQVDSKQIVYPHYFMGPMDANQWLDFLSYHLHHHRRQIEQLRAMEGFPAETHRLQDERAWNRYLS